MQYRSEKVPLTIELSPQEFRSVLRHACNPHATDKDQVLTNCVPGNVRRVPGDIHVGKAVAGLGGEKEAK